MNNKGFGAILVLIIALAIATIPTVYVVSNEIKNNNLSQQSVQTSQEFDLFLGEIDDYYADYQNPKLSESFFGVLDRELGASYAIESMIVKDNGVVYRVFASKSGQTIRLTKGVPEETIRARITIDYYAAQELLDEYKRTGSVSGIEAKMLNQKIVITPITEALKLQAILQYI